MFNMKHVDSESPSDVARWLQSESADLWAAVLGSLSLRRSRCIRGKLPGLSVWRAASKLCPLRSGERASCCRLRAGRACARGSAQSGKWARASESAGTSGTAIYQGAEARALRSDEDRRGLSGVEDSGATGQFCRLGADASGPAP